MTFLQKKLDTRFLDRRERKFAKERKPHGVLVAELEWVQSGRGHGLELILITRSKKLVASDPPEALPSGHYLKFESVQHPAEYLLFSNSGKAYRVKRKDLKDAMEQGYVKA